MSADGWAICPKCKYVSPDCTDPDPTREEYAGSLRIDHEFWNESGTLNFKMRVSLDCVECDFSRVLSEEDATGDKLAEALKYAGHKFNCDAIQPMWHKGPCDCGWEQVEAQVLKQD